jgi:uncharacterized protein YdaU (DUF1376 family)
MSRPWMPLYVADYLSDTQHLTAAEHGAYLLLIMQYWIKGSLPDNDVRLARMVRMSEAEWTETRPTIEAFFQPGWRHKRIDEERAEAERLTTAGRRAGKASADRRKPTNDLATERPTERQRFGNGTANDLATESQPLQSPSQEDRIGEARASPPTSFTDGSKALANSFWKALGFDDKLQIPPEFSGVDWRAIEWEKAGWTADLIDAEARKLARDSPLKPLNYFEKVFATSFAKRQAPLPIVEIRDAEKLTVTHERPNGNATIWQRNGNGNPNGTATGNVVQAADRLVEKIKSFDAGPDQADDVRSGTGEAAARLLSQG